MLPQQATESTTEGDPTAAGGKRSGKSGSRRDP